MDWILGEGKIFVLSISSKVRVISPVAQIVTISPIGKKVVGSKSMVDAV